MKPVSSTSLAPLVLPHEQHTESTPSESPRALAQTLPQGPEGLGVRRADLKPGTSAQRQLRAQLPQPGHSLSEALLRPYSFKHSVPGNTKTLLAMDTPLWQGSDERLAAHRIVLEAAQSHLGKQIGGNGKAPAAGSALAKFASGKLDHVYVDARNFKALADAAGRVDGRPEKYPVYVDTKRNQLVVDIDRAFVAGDDFSPDARRGLIAALGLGKKGAELLPRYQGHAISSKTRGADFFKPNTHPQIHGEQPNVTAFAHPHYLEAQDTKALGKEIVSHRGLFDNRNGIPENSLAAIDAAYKAGHRSLELDIEVTKDGVPVLLHDFTVGRMIDDPKNRLVSHVGWDELKDKNLVIRNPVDGNFVVTNQKVASIRDALRDVALTKPDMSIALDCKEQTAEAAFDLLKREPELRRFTALKLYAKAYPGGFDQFLGNLYDRYKIDPKSVEDRPKRQALLDTLKEIKLEPVFSPGMVTHPMIHALYPATTPMGQQSAEGAAESAMAWIRGWQAMDIKVIEAAPSDAEPLVSKAMNILRGRLAQKESGLSHVASSASYRSEDFSVPQKDGSAKFYTNQIFGLMRDETENPDAAKSETAGTLRHAGENVLTDQPKEEVYATVHDVSLARGHSGMVLDVEPGTNIDMTRNVENVDMRSQVFAVEKQQVDAQRIAAVRAGRQADAAEGAHPAGGAEKAGTPHLPAAAQVALGAATLGVAAAALKMRVPQRLRNAIAGRRTSES